MKTVKLLLSAASALFVVSAAAQDFSDPRWAVWGETPQERQENILNANFLQEEVKNKRYDQAAYYLKELLDKRPQASENIYISGSTIYKSKIARSKSADEKKVYIDSLLLLYDMRAEHFANHPKRGKSYILDRKAREVLNYLPEDRAAIREAFRAAIEAGGAATNPETMVAYFSNLCDDFKNTDEVLADEVFAEYERLTPYFEENPDAADYKAQLDAAFGLSGVADCESLETLFRPRLEADPNDEKLLSQAMKLMTRAKCTSDFYVMVAEKYYEVKPSADTAVALAGIFQGQGDYTRAAKYLNETLAVEQDPVERQKLLVRIALVDMAAGKTADAAAAARQARELDPEEGTSYFVLGQCYAISAANCSGIAAQAAFWAAYDTMAKAVELLPSDSEFLTNAKASLSTYRSHFPTQEECFFNEMKNGERYTVTCGLASGVVTTVRAR